VKKKSWVNRKSLVFKSSVILAVLFFLLESILTTTSYLQLRSQQTEEILNMEWTLHNVIAQNYGAIEKAKKLVGMKEFTQDPGIQSLQRQLDSMNQNQLITNSYIYLPEVATNGDNKKVTILLANQAMYDMDTKPGDPYEATGAFAKAFDQMAQDGYAMSEVYEDKYGEWISIISTITDKDGKKLGIFGIDFKYSLLKEQQSDMLIKTVSIALSVVLAFIVLAIVLVRIVLRPIRKLSELSMRVADGDLTVNIPVHNQDEVGILSANFNTMIHNIRQLIQNVQTTATNVATSSNMLTTSAEQTSRATEEIAGSIQEVASGSETQMQSAMESQVAMEEMATGIQRIAESSSRLSDYAREVSGNAEQGNTIIRQSVHEMQEIHQSVTQTVEILANLQQQSQEIEHILSTITNIAGQTNLLALNASIEAARVGEHGKGFAVVALEVRKLADLSHNSSQQISELLNDIAANIGQASTAMNTSMSQVEHGARAVHSAGETFGDIVGALQSVNEQVHEVSAAAEQMSASSEQVAASLDELARIGQNASQNSQSVAASSEEQMAMMQEISSSASTLRDMVMDLDQEVKKFKLEE